MKHNNIEALLVDYLDGKLNPQQIKEVEAIIAGNDEYADMIAAWSQIKVEPDYTVMYSNKAALKHKNVIALPIWSKWAVAASLALAVSCALWVWNSNGIQNQETGIASTQEMIQAETIKTFEPSSDTKPTATASSSMLNQLLSSKEENTQELKSTIATQPAAILASNYTHGANTRTSHSISIIEKEEKLLAQAETPMSKLQTIEAKAEYQQSSERLNFTRNQAPVKFRTNALATIENSLFTDAYSGLKEEVKDKLKELQPSQLKNSLRNSSFFSEFRDALVPTSLEETLAMNK